MKKETGPDALKLAQKHFLRIANHYFHDATLESIRVVPIRSKREKAQIEVLLSFPHAELMFSLSFRDCCNVSLALDFDVLEDNGSNQTVRFSALKNAVQVQEFMTSQVPLWNMKYSDVRSADPCGFTADPSPLAGKLAKAHAFTLYRVRYFGGELSVIAKSHKIRRLPYSPKAEQETRE